MIEIKISGNFDIHFDLSHCDGLPVSEPLQWCSFQQLAQWQLKKFVVFLEAFWLEGEKACVCCFDSVQFLDSFGSFGHSMWVFVLLQPWLNGVICDDDHDSGCPSVFTSLIVCFRKE